VVQAVAHIVERVLAQPVAHILAQLVELIPLRLVTHILV
jgi:hypothetical protein